jgi:hypothetical protein
MLPRVSSSITARERLLLCALQLKQEIAGDPKTAIFGLMHCSKTMPSFDYRVVESKQCRRREMDISTDQDGIAFVATLN